MRTLSTYTKLATFSYAFPCLIEEDFDMFAKQFQEQESCWERTRRISALLGVEAPPHCSVAYEKWRAERKIYLQVMREPHSFEAVHAIRLGRVHDELQAVFKEEAVRTG